MNLLENPIYQASLDEMLSDQNLSFLEGKTVLVAGASGMLGSCIIDALMCWNKYQQRPCKIIAIGRKEEWAKRRFSMYFLKEEFSFLSWDICRETEKETEAIDYIIHAASNADPAKMIANPVDTLAANTIGTQTLIEHGRKCNMKRFLYVSSGEVYGQPDESKADFTEDYCGPLDLSDVRTCYPEGKRAGEVLCQSYIHEYNIDAVIVRPCHLFGPTTARQDSRAASEFLWQAAEGEAVVMKSSGLRERSHCYIVDAVAALLLVLRDGSCGEAYNIAALQCQTTIRGFAELAAHYGQCELIGIDPTKREIQSYSHARRSVLHTKKLQMLGWSPRYDLDTGMQETIQILRQIILREKIKHEYTV